MDGGLDPITDFLKQRVARPLPGDDVQPSLAPKSGDINPGALEPVLHTLIGLVVPKEDAEISLPDSGSEEAYRGLELLLGLPEVRQVIAGRHSRLPETERNAALAM